MNCKDIINYGKWFIDPQYIDHYPCLKLPETFDKYWNKVLKKQARYEWRKAKQCGCRLEMVENVKSLNKDIINIWQSQKNRTRTHEWRYNNDIFAYQDIYQKKRLFTDQWVNQEYPLTCPKHNLRFWAVMINDRLVAYMETVRIDDILIVQSVLGHTDFLKYGINKFLFIEVIKRNFDVKYFFYANNNCLKDHRRHFLKQLGITSHYENKKKQN